MEITTVTKVIKDLNLPPADLYLWGDGSGTVIEKSCASFCVSYMPAICLIKEHYSYLSHGTNNAAELLPYLNALYYYKYTQERRSGNTICIVSDSELTVKQGMRLYVRDANKFLWAAMDSFENDGYILKWHHVSRNSNPVNAYCDKMAGILRKGIDNLYNEVRIKPCS